LEAHPL
jgi:hypothetical protein